MSKGRGFQAKSQRARAAQLPGSRVSVHNSQPLVSSGVPSLDTVLGGGLPVGSLLMLEEDEHAVYSKFFLQCFMAEGVTVGHELMVSSLDMDPEVLVREMPAPVGEKTKSQEEHKATEGKVEEDAVGDMKIAWRYQEQKKVDVVNESDSFGHHFDLKTTISSDVLDRSEKYCWGRSYFSNPKKLEFCSSYRELYQTLHNLLTERQFFTSSKRTGPANIMRIAVHSIASFSWGDDLSSKLSDHSWSDLTTFFALLRAVLRQSYAVAVVTIPSHLFTDPALISRLSHHADCVLGLESFQGTDKEVNPLFKDYHGLLNVYKVSASNSLVPPPVETKDWVFKLKRKKLCIEKLHLPPDLSETVSRNQADPVKSGAAMCSGGLPSKLEF